MLSLIACLPMWDPPEKVSDQTFSAGPYTVRETIHRHPGIPDSSFVRQYSLVRPGPDLVLGEYEDESGLGITTMPPEVQDGRLVIRSQAHLLILEGDRVVHLSPYAADGFIEQGINGHYDVAFAEVRFDGPRWRAELVPVGEGGPALALESMDSGERWRVSSAPPIVAPAP
jgi:hypothetical protein